MLKPGEDANVNDLRPIPMSSPPRHCPISHQEHAHMSSLPELFRVEERLVETPVWLIELKAHLDQKLSSMKSKFREDL